MTTRVMPLRRWSQVVRGREVTGGEVGYNLSAPSGPLRGPQWWFAIANCQWNQGHRRRAGRHGRSRSRDRHQWSGPSPDTGRDV